MGSLEGRLDRLERYEGRCDCESEPIPIVVRYAGEPEPLPLPKICPICGRERQVTRILVLMDDD